MRRIVHSKLKFFAWILNVVPIHTIMLMRLKVNYDCSDVTTDFDITTQEKKKRRWYRLTIKCVFLTLLPTRSSRKLKTLHSGNVNSESILYTYSHYSKEIASADLKANNAHFTTQILYEYKSQKIEDTKIKLTDLYYIGSEWERSESGPDSVRRESVRENWVYMIYL